MRLINEIRGITERAKRKITEAEEEIAEAKRIKEQELDRSADITAQGYFKDVAFPAIRRAAEATSTGTSFILEDYRVALAVARMLKRENFACVVDHTETSERGTPITQYKITVSWQ